MPVVLSFEGVFLRGNLCYQTAKVKGGLNYFKVITVSAQTILLFKLRLARSSFQAFVKPQGAEFWNHRSSPNSLTN